MQSLRDKLLKAGLITEADATRAESQQPRAPARPAPAAFSPVESRLPKLPPLAGTKAANRELARKQLELDRQLRDTVMAAEVPLERGEVTFHFVTRKNKLRRLELSAEQAKLLEVGALAVVERPDPDKIEHALVPADVALQLLPLSDKVVRFLNRVDQRVGFLTDDEIHRRASEAEEPPDEAASAPAPASAAAPASTSEPAPAEPAQAEPASATSETWITVRRARQ